jgi:hypothetical protein
MLCGNVGVVVVVGVVIGISVTYRGYKKCHYPPQLHTSIDSLLFNASISAVSSRIIFSLLSSFLLTAFSIDLARLAYLSVDVVSCML